MKSMLKITCLSAACIAALASCQKEMTPAVAPEQPSAKTYTLTVDATKGEDTKALSLDGNTLNVKWAGTDQVSVFAGDWSGDPMGTLTATASETGSTTLTGPLSPAPTVGDNLNLLFPRAEWNYTGQKGILLSDASSIEKKYDYALATVTVDEVNAGEITTTASANFTSQQAIVKFRLTDGTDPIAVNSLKIAASSNKLVTNKSYRGAGTKTYYYGNGYYTVTAGSGGFNNEQHGKLVDNDLGTKWCANKPSGNWYIEFQTASAIQVDGYMLRTGGDTWPETGRNPQSWVLYGKKNSGESWSVIDSKTDNYDMPNASNAEKDFDADAPGQYKFFRLEISAVRGGNCMQMSEMRLFSYEYYEMGTTYGAITVTPDDAASELTVALRNEYVGDDTYTLTATVGSSTYTFSKSGIAFENGKYYDIRVPMQPKKVSSITLNKSSINLTIGSTQTLSVSSVAPADAVDKSVTWSSSATSVATVNATTGKVTAVAEGTATITATANDGSGTTATCTVKVYPEGTVIWDSSNISDLYVSGTYASYTKEGIKLSANADEIFANWYGSGDYGGISFDAMKSGGFTFTAPTGKQFTKIEMTLRGPAGWDYASLGTGWSYSEDIMTEIRKVTWTGTAASVGLLTGADHFSGERVKSIVFMLK